MKFNVITGMPRSGSTLLCNILNQNPEFRATSTSTLAGMLSGMSHFWSNSIEIKNLLEKEKEKTEDRMVRSARAFVEQWHKDEDAQKVIFDKSRGWCVNALLLRKIFPESKIIAMIRDLRGVFGSVEKQHQKNPLLDEANNPQMKTIFSRADAMFSPNGLIGAPVIGVEDMLRRKIENVIYVQYESFSAHPKLVLERVYEQLGEKNFEHDFDNVVNTADDPDGHYLYKYPHTGEGKVEERNPNEWKHYVSQDLANTIIQRFPGYNKMFGYV